MKILMVLDKKFPTDIRVENEATSLIRAGHKVGLLSIADNPQQEIVQVKGIKVYREKVSRFKRDKMHGLAGMVPWIDQFVAKKVSAILDSEQYDAVHFHDLYLFGAARLIRKKHDVYFVGDMHENYVEVLKDYKWATKFPNRLLVSQKKWERKEKEWLADMDKVITVSKGIEDRIINKGVSKEDVILVPNTIHTRLFDEFETDQRIINKFKDYFTLVYVGGFVSNRGLEHVIKGMKGLSKKAPDIRLILVGDGDTRTQLQAIVKENELSDQVFFEGWQSQEKIKSYLEVADVGLVPFKRTPQTDNSSSNKLFQYMYFGLPILGTNCTSVKKLVEKENCGLIYESENTIRFIESVMNLYENRSRAKELGKNGKKAVIEKYSWDKTIQDMLKMYSNLAEN
ncbi:glycosyltransferase family 4 protein [Gracilimonas sp.]|uniref:glycosyltransferase family 4 protein n=1 Tax=Gracilimonas sp. TaxID=1974203 RepID=UPI0032F048F4